MAKEKNITMRDIAKEAGVSVATVSRIINNTGVTKEETKLKVKRIIDKYDYMPNGLARSLYTKKSNMIGFIIPDITNEFYSQLFLEAEKYALKLGYSIFLCNSMDDRVLESLYLEKLVERQVDGIIMAGGRINRTKTNPEYANEMKKINNRIPIVLINGIMSGLESLKISSNEYDAIYKMARYLTNLGHERIGLIGGIKGITTFDIKKKAFYDAGEEMGYSFEKDWIVEGEYSIEGGIKSMEKLLQNNEVPSAVIAINDLVAIGAMKVCEKHGMIIPNDISIVGFDNIELSKAINPALTTISHPYEELGRRAVQSVHDLHKNHKLDEDVWLDTELIIRDSCRKIQL